MPVPVIAAVNGHAYAGGLEMMLACDFAYAVPGARFALTEVTLGIMPGAGGTQILPRAVGERRAKEIILTGSPFSAEEAQHWGLVNRLCAPEALMERALATAAQIADNAPLAVRQAKKSIHTGLQMDLKSASCSRSRLTTAWSRPRTGARASPPSTRSGSPASRGAER